MSCETVAVRGFEDRIESTLRDAQALPHDEHLVAAWSGYLIEFRPSLTAIDEQARPTAILCVTHSAIYVVSEAVLRRISFDRLRGPHSPHRDVLRFSVLDADNEPGVVTMAVKGANAIASQLTDALRNPTSVGLSRPRARAKHRPRAEYVD
jgi:hypothetical protein